MEQQSQDIAKKAAVQVIQGLSGGWEAPETSWWNLESFIFQNVL